MARRKKSKKRQQEVVNQHGSPFPICSPRVNASSWILCSVLPPGWLSVGSRWGGLGRAFSLLNPDLATMPVLLVEHDNGSCQLCSLLAPDIPNLLLTVDELVLLCVSQPPPQLGSSAAAAFL
jgi:hypothetical protein